MTAAVKGRCPDQRLIAAMRSPARLIAEGAVANLLQKNGYPDGGSYGSR